MPHMGFIMMMPLRHQLANIMGSAMSFDDFEFRPVLLLF